MKSRVFFVALLSTLSFRAEAQVTGSIYGVVKDASGGVLPGATVTATSPALQRESIATVTGETGAYRFSLLPAGLYAVHVELAGFTPVSRTGIPVAVNQEVALDVILDAVSYTHLTLPTKA